MEVSSIESSQAEALDRSTEGCLPEHQRDREADRRIQECLSSSVFTNQVIPYSYHHRCWEVQIILDPENEQCPSSLYMKEPLPEELIRHIIQLFIQELGEGPSYVGLYKPDFDKNINQKIRTAFQTSEFQHTVLDYPYQGKSYRLHLIHNPQHLPLGSNSLNSIVWWEYVLASPDSLPSELTNHLTGLIPVDKNETSLVELGMFPKHASSFFYALQPVKLFSEGELHNAFEQEIREIFSSQELVNRLFYFQFQEEVYKLRLVHNPQFEHLAAVYPVRHIDHAADTVVHFHFKYGIFTNRPVPQEIIDRLIQLAHPSWFEKKFSCDIQNGTTVVLEKHTHVNSLDTGIAYCDWFSNLLPWSKVRPFFEIKSSPN